MNTEKIEKLKKSLSNSKIPADLKPKIEAEIKRLEDLDAKISQPKEEVKEEEKPVAKTRKPRATKSVAKKTSTRKPSETSKPKRTAMSVAKEIRKEGESWKDAMARASKVMKEKTHTATKDVESELEKLTKLVRGEKNKEKVSRVSDTNLKRDASRKAKPLGARKVTRSGETSNQYGTYKNHLGRKYVENRDKHGDRLAPRYPKNAPLLAEGGYLTDPTFGNFQNTMFADGGGIPNNYEGKTPEQIWNSLSLKQREHFLLDHYYVDEDEFFQQQVKWLDSEDKKMIDYYSNKTWNKLSAEVKKAFTSHVKLGQYAKGGGIRRKNGQTYDYGRVWTKDHNEFDKGADHEVEYRRKKKFATGGGVDEKENINLGNNFNLEIIKSYYTDGNFNYVGILLYKNYTFKYFAGGLNDTREKAIQNVRNYLKTLSVSDKIIEKKAVGSKRPPYAYEVFYTDRNGEHLRVEDTKKEIDEFIKDVNAVNSKKFELGGNVVTDLAGHTGGTLGTGDPSMLDGVSGTAYTGLVGETGAMSSGEMFAKGGDIPFQNSNLYLIGKGRDVNGNKIIKVSFPNQRAFSIQTLGDLPKTHDILRVHDKIEDISPNDVKIIEKEVLEYVSEFGSDKQKKSLKKYELGGGLPQGASQSYMITESLGNPAQHFAKGGGVRQVGNREYSYGRNWTNDHEHTNKGEEHEVTYKRKGKFLGVFAKGGGVKGDRYDGKTEKIVEELKKLKGGLDNKAPYVYQRNGFIYVSAEEGDNYADYDNYLYIDEKLEDFADKYDTYWDWENAGAIVLVPLSDEDEYAKGGGVRKVGNREYSYGRNWTNDHEHTNKGEEHEVKYNRKRSFATGGGVDDESPKIYVADLEAYNNGRLSGVWLDLADYSDADELMEAIQDFLKTTGGEEYAIHDVEYIPSNMYSEYMGQKDFEELYEMIDLAKENDLPLSVVQEVVSQYDASAVDEFQGRYDDAEDFAQSLVDDTGIESFTDFEYYLYITDTDRRLLSQEMADNYVDDIRDEDGGNRLIEEAGLDVEEYEEAESDRQEEMLDEAREIVYDEYYNTWFEGLSDPYYFLVEEQGIYDAESFANADFVRVDFEKLADALEQDYTYIYDGGSLYVFNIR
jgi:antirestriction protein